MVTPRKDHKAVRFKTSMAGLSGACILPEEDWENAPTD